MRLSKDRSKAKSKGELTTQLGKDVRNTNPDPQGKRKGGDGYTRVIGREVKRSLASEHSSKLLNGGRKKGKSAGQG